MGKSAGAFLSSKAKANWKAQRNEIWRLRTYPQRDLAAQFSGAKGDTCPNQAFLDQALERDPAVQHGWRVLPRGGFNFCHQTVVLPRPLIRLTMKSTRNTTKQIFASNAAVPATTPKPRKAATSATIRNRIL
jgi:hypothetical protein